MADFCRVIHLRPAAFHRIQNIGSRNVADGGHAGAGGVTHSAVHRSTIPADVVLLYGLIVVHALVLIVGGFYTYAKVPFGFWLEQTLSLSRNPYDRIGHLLQGFVPALIARELFIRGGYVSGKKMTVFLSICVVMFISSCYELIEWAAALSLGQGADQFLGTQGDPWDTQSDMFMALLGSILALVTLSRVQDGQIRQLEEKKAASKQVRE